MRARVLVVDDSALMRRMLIDAISADPSLTVVGTASDGNEAVAQVVALKPDVVTMDVQMPVRDGLSALAEIMNVCPTRVVMVSTLTTQGASATLEALELGAVDFLAKPSADCLSLSAVQIELRNKVRAAFAARVPTTRTHLVKAATPSNLSNKVVLIASSTGGPRALATVFQTLPKGLGAAFLLVQHMPEGFTKSLAERLDALGTVPCQEATHGARTTPGKAFLAPGGQHMMVTTGGEIQLSSDPSLHGVRPAADLLFHSAAKVFGNRCIAVVLTGMGKDGAEGALAVRKAGGVVLAESESTATVYGMPKAATQLGATHAEYPIGEMGQAIVASMERRSSVAS